MASGVGGLVTAPSKTFVRRLWLLLSLIVVVGVLTGLQASPKTSEAVLVAPEGVCIWEVQFTSPEVLVGWTFPPCDLLDRRDSLSHASMRHSKVRPSCVHQWRITTWKEIPMPVFEPGPCTGRKSAEESGG